MALTDKALRCRVLAVLAVVQALTRQQLLPQVGKALQGKVLLVVQVILQHRFALVEVVVQARQRLRFFVQTQELMVDKVLAPSYLEL
jgi:hypothetical protein